MRCTDRPSRQYKVHGEMGCAGWWSNRGRRVGLLEAVMIWEPPCR